MVFTYYDDYYLYGIIIPVVIAVVLLVFAVVLTLYLHRKKAGVFTQAAPLMAVLASYILMILSMYTSLDFLEYLPQEKKETEIRDIILIEKVEKASAFPLFYIEEQRDICSASIITSSRGTFLAIDANSIQSGQYAEITYLPYSHCVLTINTVSEQQAADYWKTHPFSPTAPPKTGFQETGQEGSIILCVMFLLMIKVEPIEYFIVPLTRFLWKRDSIRNAKIKPRLFGILEKAYTEMVFIFGGIYSITVNTYTVALICFCLALGYGYYFLEIVSTRVSFSEEAFYFQSITTHLTIKKESIVYIRWEDRRKEYGKALSIVLDDRRILHFLIVDFIGLKAFIKWCNQDIRDGLGEPY